MVSVEAYLVAEIEKACALLSGDEGAEATVSIGHAVERHIVQAAAVLLRRAPGGSSRRNARSRVPSLERGDASRTGQSHAEPIPLVFIGRRRPRLVQRRRHRLGRVRGSGTNQQHHA